MNRSSFQTAKQFNAELAESAENRLLLRVLRELVLRDDVDVDVFPISLLLMLRTKIFSGPFDPLGFQPYVGVGPGLFVSWVHDDALTISIDGLEESVEDISYDLGLDTRAGLRFHLTHSFGLFAEYRFTYYEPEFEDDGFGASIEIESELATHHVVAGLGFQF